VVSRRHDCIAVRIRDPREADIPPAGLVQWVDAETGQTLLVDTSSARTRQALVERATRHNQQLERLLRRLDVDHVDIDTTASYIEPLQAFFSLRTGRRRRRP
jgi:uncharacterized protein (DUF58 family)